MLLAACFYQIKLLSEANRTTVIMVATRAYNPQLNSLEEQVITNLEEALG
jgi:hypothetical protein